MDHATNLAHVVEQGEALRAAAVAAGPDAPVPSCPKWTVHDLVSHIGGVHAWVRASLRLTPGDPRPERPQPPTDWQEVLDWWDEQRTAMIAELGAEDPSKQVWGFIPELGSVGWWGRRQAHETAIHRLDAELARSEDVPTLLFDSELAADGIDEVVAMLSPLRAQQKRPEVTVEGTLLVHAADAGRAWLVVAEGGLVKAGPAYDAAVNTDATLAGTADAVYRAVWKRPSHAILNGRTDLLQAINAG